MQGGVHQPEHLGVICITLVLLNATSVLGLFLYGLFVFNLR